MEREATAREQRVIRGGASIADSIPILYCATQVIERPSLPISASRVWPKQRARSVQAQLATEIGDLLGCEFGTVATTAMIGQRLNTASTIGSTPLHQARAGTAGNLDNLWHAVAEAIE